MQEYVDKLRQSYVDQPVKWATIAGLVLLIIGVFPAWATVDFDTPIGNFGGSTNGFDHNGTITLILALIGLGAIAAYTFANIQIQQSMLLWGLVAGAVVIDILLLLDFIDITTEDTPPGVDISVGFGLWLSILGAILLSAGAIVPMWGEITSRAQSMQKK